MTEDPWYDGDVIGEITVQADGNWAVSRDGVIVMRGQGRTIVDAVMGAVRAMGWAGMGITNVSCNTLKRGQQ